MPVLATAPAPSASAISSAARVRQLFEAIAKTPAGVSRDDFGRLAGCGRHAVNRAWRDLEAELAGGPVGLAVTGSRSHGAYRLVWLR